MVVADEPAATRWHVINVAYTMCVFRVAMQGARLGDCMPVPRFVMIVEHCLLCAGKPGARGDCTLLLRWGVHRPGVVRALPQ